MDFEDWTLFIFDGSVDPQFHVGCRYKSVYLLSLRWEFCNLKWCRDDHLLVALEVWRRVPEFAEEECDVGSGREGWGAPLGTILFFGHHRQQDRLMGPRDGRQLFQGPRQFDLACNQGGLHLFLEPHPSGPSIGALTWTLVDREEHRERVFLRDQAVFDLPRGSPVTVPSAHF